MNPSTNPIPALKPPTNCRPSHAHHLCCSALHINPASITRLTLAGPYPLCPELQQDPVCKHGGTLTKPVSFRACVNAVRASAFSTSPYPVVITLELHADEANQRDMADVIAHELGPALYVPQPGEPGEGWKSPHDLQHKVRSNWEAAGWIWAGLLSAVRVEVSRRGRGVGPRCWWCRGLFWAAWKLRCATVHV